MRVASADHARRIAPAQCVATFRCMAPESKSSPFARTVAFTGRLAAIKREEAFALVRDRGGTPRRGVTNKNEVLVVCAHGWPLRAEGRPSEMLALAKN